MDHGHSDERRPVALSTLLQRSIVVSAALATLLFAAPLAVSVNGLYRAQALSDLAREAEKLRTSLSGLDGPGTVPVDPSLVTIAQPDAVELGVYSASGALLAGDGPSVAEPVVTEVAGHGVEEDAVVQGHLVVAVPIPRVGGPGQVVRAASHYSVVQKRTYLTWGLMAGLAALVLLVVAGLARARARAIARPLQRLTQAAEALGQGDFSVRATGGGVAEVDAVSRSLERTARRLGGLLERERSFSADASHQLRTPLAAVRVGLEGALMTPGADLRAAADQALHELDRLEQTVLDLIAVSRDMTGTASSPVAIVVDEVVRQRWARVLQQVGRHLEVTLDPDLPAVAVAAPALRTVLDVLLGNALAHGAGTVRLRGRREPDAVTIEVADDGPGVTGDLEEIFRRRSPEARGTGIGLALARSLVEADGGQLEVVRAQPVVFALRLPAVQLPGEWTQRGGAS